MHKNMKYGVLIDTHTEQLGETARTSSDQYEFTLILMQFLSCPGH